MNARFFFFFENNDKISVFNNIPILVDEALDIGVSSDTCGCKYNVNGD